MADVDTASFWTQKLEKSQNIDDNTEWKITSVT